ncbi:hypothetical protein [Nocardioides sp.]|uniref:hypothetical protein n=1 Tax=Nocardioides sp. TaxID=35761 RepID=UPI0026017E68|nr:hypothetical protein [Nocardioides sp.]
MTWLFRRWRPLAVAVITSAVAVGVGVSLSDPAAPVATPLAHSLSTLDTTTMTLARAPMCGAVDAADVTAALGAGAATSTTWKNGDTAPLGSVSDVAHEYGCSWTAGARSASAWVFAPPVTVAEAGDLVAAAKAVKGCTPIPGAPAFGSPSIALSCGDTVSYRGLYGDAWLVCTLTGPSATTTPLALRWCASVALAAQRAPTAQP